MSPTITKKGRELAWKLNPAIGTTSAIEETCSLIARHATTHHAYTEMGCNSPPDGWEDRWTEMIDERLDQLEARITRLIEDLPHTDDGPFGPYFQHDPRGCTVGLTAPDPWTYLYDGWGQDRINVPQL